MKALFLYNSKARKAAGAFVQSSKILDALGIELVKPRFTEVSDFAKAIDYHKDEVDAVIVAGGDGSVSAAAAAMVKLELPLGVLPLGTANNFARNLNIPIDLQKACETIAGGNIATADVCYVNSIVFLNVVGLGLSTRVNKEISREIKKRFGTFGYLITAFKIALGFRPIRVRLLNEELKTTENIRTFQLTICNGKFFGSGIAIDESASIYDGKIDLCSFEVADIWSGIKLLLRFRFKRLSINDPIRRVRATSYRIESVKPQAVDVDGEIKTQTPLDIRLSPNSLKVFIPAPVPSEPKPQ